jgi:small multidrug resistance pump
MISKRLPRDTALTSTGFYLVLAILLEVAGTTSMKLSDGFNHVIPSVLIFIFYALSFIFLTLTLKRLEVSFVYAVWSGIGTSLIAIIGFVFFHEPVTMLKVSSLALIIIGIMGLKLG